MAATAAEKAGFLKYEMSMAGLLLRFSWRTNTTRTARPPMIGRSAEASVKSASSPPRMMPYTSSTRPTTESATPSGSSRPGFGSLESGTSTAMAITATTTTGTLTRKTEPHQKCSRSSPPVIGPMAMPRPTLPAQRPMALGCSSRSKTFIRTARVAGMTKAAPKPITARQVTSSPGDPDMAAKAEPTPNRMMPKSSTFLRPMRSPSRPAVNRRPAKTSV